MLNLTVWIHMCWYIKNVFLMIIRWYIRLVLKFESTASYLNGSEWIYIRTLSENGTLISYFC